MNSIGGDNLHKGAARVDAGVAGCGCDLVSIVIPTHGRPGMVRRAVESALAQTHPRVEVVVIDDNLPGSAAREQTAEVLAALQREMCRDAGGGAEGEREAGPAQAGKELIVLQTAGEVGGGAARNQACAMARGRYLCFLDDDDEFLPEKVGRQLAFMREHGLEMCYHDAAWYDESGALAELRRLDHARGATRDELLRAHLLKPISPSAVYMVERGLFERAGGFGCTATGQDWHLMLRCIEAGGRIGYMPGAFARNYLHGGRLSVGQNKIEGERARHEVVRSHYDLLTPAERRYAEFRHNAVLAVACRRAGRTGKALAYALKAFMRAPAAAVRELRSFRNDKSGAF